MKRVVIAVVTIFMMALLPRANAHAGENVTLAAFGQPSSPQVIAAAVAEPGSPVVGKTVAVTNDLQFTIGYKGVFQKFKDNFSALDTDDLITTTSGTAKSKPRYNGGTIGIAANVPIPEAGWIPAGFSIYGNGGGGVMGSNDFRVAFYGT